MYQVYLGLGTNLGNRKRNIREAIDKIGEQIGVVERQFIFMKLSLGVIHRLIITSMPVCWC